MPRSGGSPAASAGGAGWPLWCARWTPAGGRTVPGGCLELPAGREGEVSGVRSWGSGEHGGQDGARGGMRNRMSRTCVSSRHKPVSGLIELDLDRSPAPRGGRALRRTSTSPHPPPNISTSQAALWLLVTHFHLMLSSAHHRTGRQDCLTRRQARRRLNVPRPCRC